jgi:hypothetical protein
MLPTRGERGQATVELALSLPVAALILAALFEMGSLALEHVRLIHAAREGARAAVVDSSRDAALAAVGRAGVRGAEVEIIPEARHRVQGEPLTIELSTRYRGRVPLVGAAFERLVLRTRSTMRIEVP